MVRLHLIFLLCLMLSTATGQVCSNCNPNLFYYNFINFPHQPKDTIVYHSPGEQYDYKREKQPILKTEIDQYIHNGDYWRGAQDIFASQAQPGSGWLKNFDFGTFASVIFELSNEGSGSPFVWTGKLGFVKLFKRKQLKLKHNNDEVYLINE